MDDRNKTDLATLTSEIVLSLCREQLGPARRCTGIDILYLQHSRFPWESCASSSRSRAAEACGSNQEVRDRRLPDQPVRNGRKFKSLKRPPLGGTRHDACRIPDDVWASNDYPHGGACLCKAAVIIGEVARSRAQGRRDGS